MPLFLPNYVAAVQVKFGVFAAFADSILLGDICDIYVVCSGTMSAGSVCIV